VDLRRIHERTGEVGGQYDAVRSVELVEPDVDAGRVAATAALQLEAEGAETGAAPDRSGRQAAHPHAVRRAEEGIVAEVLVRAIDGDRGLLAGDVRVWIEEAMPPSISSVP
jgi:hypothetical protein